MRRQGILKIFTALNISNIDLKSWNRKFKNHKKNIYTINEVQRQDKQEIKSVKTNASQLQAKENSLQ